MKKKHIILVASLSMVASLGISGGVLAFSPNSARAVKADGEKTTVEFDIGAETAIGDYTIDFDTDIELPKRNWTAFNWKINGQTKSSAVSSSESAGNSITLEWNGNSPAVLKYNGYYHVQIEAGTKMFETNDTKYVLKNDYNFWYAPLNNDLLNLGWIFQHGGVNANWNSEIPSFSLSDGKDGGIQGGSSRFLFTINYTKTGSWKSADLGVGNAFYYSKDDSGTYSLAFNGDESGHKLELANVGESGLALDENAAGKEYFCLYFSGLDTASGIDQFLSFYLPKGTLFGGCGEGRGCFLENDYYFTVLNDHFIGGTTKSTQELIYGPVKTFIKDNMHMGEVDYEGEGKGTCASIYSSVKTAYNALTDNQKYAFLNYSGYAEAKARLIAWAAANGDALDASNSIITKKSSSLILKGSSSGSNIYAAAIVAGALALVAGGAFFVFRKKHEN